MKNNAYFRVFIATVLTIFISFSLLGALSIALSYRRAVAERRNQMTFTLQESARYVTALHIHYGVELDNLDISMWLVMTSRVSGFELLLADSEGIVVSSSDPIPANMESIIPKDIIESVDADGQTVMMSTLGQMYPRRRQIAGVPLSANIDGSTHTYAYLFATSDAASPGEEWRKFSSAYILLSLVVMVLTSVVSFISSKKQAEPLREMAMAAGRFARGEFDVRVKDRGRKDEIGQLTEAFNFMADSMENTEQLRRDFIANLSHELKTPMTIISGFVEGVLDGTIPRGDEARYLEIISSESKRLSRLVRSMLHITTIEETSLKVFREGSFDISEVVRLVLLSFDSEIERKKLSVEAKLTDEPILARGDEDSISQVVYNLIDNAIKFSNIGSTIGLELWQQQERVFVSISNYGETIPEEELPYIFERFHKTDKSRGVDRDGAGLGLYMVKALLDNHNEDIFVTCADGTTKFIFSLTVV